MEFAVEEIPFLQEVYRPNRGQRPEIDLVFVHGLNPFSNQNHAYDTWTHQNGRCWLYHFLPDDIPEARIWIFGYNSNVATDVSEARIKDHADVLLDRLQQKRKEGRRHGDIPIIFVGHSLGGLVIKQALLNARDNSFFNPVSKSTYGLVFFGTPHQGGRGGAFGSLAARIAKFVSADRADNDLLECLKANSLFTQEASERFSHQLENYKVISFFETKPMKLGVRGISEIVVDRQSAVLNLGGSRERREALNADHSAMCKIGQKGPIYDGIVGKIRDMVDEALDWYDGSNNIFLSPDVAGRGRSSSTGRSPSGKSRDSSPRFLQQPRESAATGSPAPPTLPSRSNSNSAAYSARVIYAYVPAVQDVNDLELTPGDLITNIDTRGEASDQGWWFGYNSNGESGLFPSNFVEMQRSPSGLEFKQSRPALPASEQWSTTSLPTAERVSSPPGTGARPTARNVGNSLSEANLSVTPTGVLHNAECDNCMQTIYGVRHKCMDCSDWDYCSGCIKRAPILHNPEHRFKPIYEPEPEPEPEPIPVPDSASQFTRSVSQSDSGEVDASSVIELAKCVELMANHVLLSKFVEMTTEQSNPFEDTKSQSETQNQQENNLSLQVPPPTRMVIPPCSVCQAIPGAFPVYTCETCFGKTIVCQSCASTLQYNPSNIHKNHRFRVWLDGLWYDSRHIFFKTLPPSEPFGPPWAFQELDSIALGHNLLTENVKVLSFFQRPAGDLRLGLANVPPGTWSVTLQISTWPSPSFDENALKLLRFTKKLSVQAGTTSVGGVQAYIGPVDSLEDYIDHERVVPTVAFAGNTVLHSVVHGTLKALKVRFPNPVVIGSNGAVGLYVNYFRNSSSFTKEKWEVQQNLGFCWRLEGLKFEKRQDLT